MCLKKKEKEKEKGRKSLHHDLERGKLLIVKFCWALSVWQMMSLFRVFHAKDDSPAREAVSWDELESNEVECGRQMMILRTTHDKLTNLLFMFEFTSVAVVLIPNVMNINGFLDSMTCCAAACETEGEVVLTCRKAWKHSESYKQVNFDLIMMVFDDVNAFHTRSQCLLITLHA